MAVLTEVLQDLYLFVFKYRFGFLQTTDRARQTNAPARQVVSKQATTLPKAGKTKKSDTHLEQSGTSLTPLVIPAATLNYAQGYICSENTPLYALPTKTFDGVICFLDYGYSVQLINQQGQWWQIFAGTHKGWVHTDTLTDTKASLMPLFLPNQLNSAEDKNTKTVRRHIKDAFSASDLFLPLQNVEYVMFKLLQKNRHIVWPPERPRIAGTWQRLLKGVSGVHVGIHPKTNAVMEYIHDNNTGHVAYVESVFPDESITITELGYLTEGMYTERSLNKDEWKELRPVFIEVA